ncbi:DUF3857 domain-containing transglutaminase family protein [Thalassolituus maritimus]|uniref:DUF3857 domain-containing protein n=1 Tax=Thalassolituus maritimus TaxID=484498 RepID=A0ABP9ZYS1_9GAMM
MYFLKLFLIFISLIVSVSSLGNETVKINPPPPWVKSIPLPEVDDVPQELIQGGIYHLLSDSQIRVDRASNKTSYYQHAEYVVNQTGVEQNSQINLTFNPSYQDINLHSVHVIRGGRVIDKTDTAHVKILHREDEMQNLIYNGRLTVNIILDDVRVGDILRYSYSRIGDNPVFEEIFAYSQYVNWSVPVEKLFTRIIWEKDSDLYGTVQRSDINIVELSTDRGKEYIIERDKIRPVIIEGNTPPRFDPWATVTFSELNRWADVAQWGIKLFSEADDNSVAINEIANKIKEKYKSDSERVVAALRFVQDEIRYLGIEIAENSHVPKPVSETLMNRYGDCKDKTALLLALLERFGIDAYPALVNTNQDLEGALPNVHSFNHVIAFVQVDESIFWLDPTRSFQRGSLESISQPDFGLALVLRDEEQTLTEMIPVTNSFGVQVNDVFEVSGKEAVAFSSTTRKFGRDAERDRWYLAKHGSDTVQRDYMDFFRKFYPGVASGYPMERQDEIEGEVFIKEHYLIDDFWYDDSENGRYLATFYANIISSSLIFPLEKVRTQPYFQPHPLNVEQTIQIRFADSDWYFESETYRNDNKFFEFSNDIDFREEDNTLILYYLFRSKVGEISVSEYPEYIQLLNTVEDYLSYGVYRNYGSTTESLGDGMMSWVYENLTAEMLIAIYIGMLILVIIMWRLDQRSQSAHSAGQFFPVSATKFVGMWIITFGVYGVYWFYRNFKFIKERDNDTSMPFMRAFFKMFWFYPLWRSLKADNDKRYEVNQLPSAFVAGVLAILFAVSTLLQSKNGIWFPATVFSALLVLPLLNYIQLVNGKDSEAYKYNSKWSFRHWLLAILVAPMIALTVGGDSGVLPSHSVVSGDSLWDDDIRFMERRGIILPSDEIQYFYSDALLFKSEDGNGFTSRHVFSYWKEGADFYSVSSNFDQVRDFEVEWASNELENTIVKVINNDDTSFVIYVSAVDKKDKMFVAKLKEMWGAASNR